MPYRGPKTFGSRAEPRAVTGEATGLPPTGLPPGADRRPPGFGEASQPLMQDHPLVTGEAGANFVPHRPPRPEKSEGGVPLHIQSELSPKGDQPQAIAELVAQANAHERDQVLLGVTGSGKTFTMAKVIEATQRPALVLAPNKTLAAQLYGEFKSFFPDNAVEYFVSYYDYYQPEAYIPRTDTYIEKDSLHQRADRPHAPCGDPRADRARRRDHRGERVLHLRYRLGRDLHGDDLLLEVRRQDRAAPADRRPRRPALSAQRHELRPRLVPRARRHHRAVAGASRRPRLAHLAVRRRGREPHRVRSPDWRQDRRVRHGQGLRQLPLRDAEADAEAGGARHQGGAQAAPGRAESGPASAGSAAARAAHAVRSGDDGGDRLLRRHRELLALSHRPQARRAAADFVRISARQRARLRRRKPCHRAADRRHVPRRLPAQIDPRRIWLPPSLLHGQPSAPLRGMGRDAAADHLCLGHAWRLGAGADARRLRRAGDPAHRPDRPAGRGAPGLDASRRPDRRSRAKWSRRAIACWSPRSPSAWPRT